MNIWRNMSIALILRENFLKEYPKIHITPHSFEIAEWMTKEPDGLTEVYVYSQLMALGKEEWINPFTVFRQLQHGLTDEDKKKYWPVFDRAIKSIDEVLIIESTWSLEKLLEYGYLPYSAREMVCYADKRRKIIGNKVYK